MAIQLEKADVADCGMIHRMQVEAFQPLLDRYGDVDTNPAAEPVERVLHRLEQACTDYYLIRWGGRPVGAVRILRLEGNICRIAPLFILPAFQGRGLAQQAIKQVESLYPQAAGWRLDTIGEEAALCHLYEKMGYRKTGREEPIQPGMTIVYYAK